MKWKTILLLTVISMIGASLLRNSQNANELNPSTVKSPGGFENVAPDAKGIVTPSYAGNIIYNFRP